MSLNCVFYANSSTFYIVLSKEIMFPSSRGIILDCRVYLTDALICSTVWYGALFITVILLAGILSRILLQSAFVRLLSTQVYLG
jgi:hypothetical protein